MNPTNVKLLSSLRLLSTRTATDISDDAAYLSEESFRVYFHQFCIDGMDIYGRRFCNIFPCSSDLKHKVDSYTKILLQICICSGYFMKYICNNCPATTKGLYVNRIYCKIATIQYRGMELPHHILLVFVFGTSRDKYLLKCPREI